MDEAETKTFNEIKAANEALQTQLKGMVKAEEHQAILTQLTTFKTQAEAATKAATEANKVAEEAKKVALEVKRTAIVNRGVPTDKVKNLTENELSIVELAMDISKPGMDKGVGGGSALVGSPMELARAAYSKGK